MNRFMAAIVLASLAMAPAPAGAQASRVGRLTYAEQQQAYETALADYKAALARYEAARADYDRKHGRGTYDRTHRPPMAPAAPPPPPAPPPQAYSPTGGAPYLGSTCFRRPETDRAALAAAMAGALGSGPAAASSKSEGAVLGALIDGTLGVNLASSETSGRRYAPECDPDGFYFSSDQTFPYRESAVRKQRNGEHDQQYYFAEGCRLAVAPITTRTKAVEYHYARVCPDRRGRYRFTS